MLQFGKGPKRVQLKDFFEKAPEKRSVKGIFPPKAVEFIYELVREIEKSEVTIFSPKMFFLKYENFQKKNFQKHFHIFF